MARNIGATLSLNNGNFFTNMKSAVNASKSLKQSLSSTTSGMKGFSLQSNATGNVLTSLASKAAIAIGAFVGIRQAVNFGKDVVKTGMEFEQGMANVSAISGATGDELKALSEKAKEMGATTKFSAIEASDAMKYMAMAGWNSSQMIDGISGIMNLAAASGEDLASVSDIVTDSLTAFGLQAKDSAEFADILAVASSKSNTNVAMLGESFKNVAPVAGAMGYSVRDTTVALGLMANAGIKSSDAGTSLRSVMTRLAKPTADVSKALNQLGIEVTAADGSMKPLNELIPELQTKFAGLTESERGQYATMIAGKNAMSGFLSIVNSSPADFQALTDAINDSEGAAQKMADTMNDTVQGKLTLLKSQFEGVKIAIFDALGSSQFKDVLQALSDGLKAATPYLTAFTVAIGNGLFLAIRVTQNIMSNFGSVMTAMKPIVDGLKYLFSSFGQTIQAVFESPAIEYFKSALQTVGDAFNRAFSNTKAIDSITGLFGELVTSVVDVASEVITALAPLLPAVVDIIGSIAQAAKSLLPPIVQIIKGAVKAVTPIIKSIASGVKSLFSAIAPLIEKLAVIISPVISIVSGVAQVLGNVLAPVITVISGLLTGVIKVVDVLFGVVVGVFNAIKAVFAPVVEFFAEKFQVIQNVVMSAWDKIKGAVRPVWDAIKTVWDAAAPYFQGIGDWINQVFGVVGIYIKGAFETAWTSIKFVWDTATGFFSAVWDTIAGIFSVVGSVLTGDWSGAWEGIKGIVGTWGDFFSGVWDGIKGIFASVGSWFGNTFSAAWNAVKSAFSGVTGFFQNMWNTIKNTFVNIGTTIANGISGAFKSVVNAVIGFASNTINGFIRSVNWAIGVINKIPGVNIPSLQEVSLPRLAKGGIATTATIAEIGEAGDEAVLPLTAFWNKLEQYLAPQPQAAAAVTNNIYVTIDGRNADDETLANRVAHRIVEVIENM